MDLLLKEKVAIVTGASRGIGRAIAATLAAEGAYVVAVARTRSTLDKLSGELPGRILAVEADLRDPAMPQEVIRRALTPHGRRDILVNNAGATQRGDFLTLTDEQWQGGFALTFSG